MTVDLSAGTATDTSGVEHIQNVIGGSGADALTGDANANRLAGGGGGDTLAGGAGDDTYVLTSAATVTITEASGGGSDTLDYSGYTSSVTVDLGTGAATGIASGFSNVENVDRRLGGRLADGRRERQPAGRRSGNQHSDRRRRGRHLRPHVPVNQHYQR